MGLISVQSTIECILGMVPKHFAYRVPFLIIVLMSKVNIGELIQAYTYTASQKVNLSGSFPAKTGKM